MEGNGPPYRIMKRAVRSNDGAFAFLHRGAAMNLAQLHYFSRLAEFQHYSHAAEELHITQPSLSSSISSLEKELGVPLFQKVGRNVRLTKYGAEFLEYVNEGLERIDTGIAVMREYAGSNTGGTIDVGCIYTLQDSFLPKLMVEYQTYIDSSTVFNVQSGTTAPLLDDLKNGKLDVAFIAKDENAEEIAFIPVAAQKLLVAMSSSCPLAKKDFVIPSDLVRQDILTYKADTPIGSSLKRLLQEHGITVAHYDYLDESILAGLAAKSPGKVAVLAGTLIAYNTPDVVLRELRSEKEHRSLYHRVYLAYEKKRRRPYCVERFIRYIENECPLETIGQIFID